ncbi:MAG: glycosyltransferase [Bacteriovoracaceae bacterium]|jgi:glycosyltransferase involved in cell wall biosynthesis|nr:glycosyltransferase [Bacteriovoracaceae bacterium]
MISKIKKIGIALAIYNPNLNLLERQLKSIISQLYTNWVCVLSVDEDRDNVLINESILSLIDNQNFFIYRNKVPYGYPKNFVFASETLLLDFNPDAIAFCDQDDFWRKDKLLILVRIMNEESSSMVHSDAKLVNINNKTISSKSLWEKESRNPTHSFFHQVVIRNIVAGATALIRTSHIKDNIKIPQDVCFHDHWYAAVCAKVNKISYTKELLNNYSQHDGNLYGNSEISNIISREDISTNIFSKSLKRYQISKDLAKNVLMNRSSTIIEYVLFKTRLDLGLLSFFLFLKAIPTDRGLARAYLSFTIGKIVSLFV